MVLINIIKPLDHLVVLELGDFFYIVLWIAFNFQLAVLLT